MNLLINNRALRIFVSVLMLSSIAGAESHYHFKNPLKPVSGARKVSEPLIESVEIQGNRRYKDEDLIYYIKTRAGDALDAAQIEHDLQQLLALNFFDKSATRVLTEPGARGGVKVIFEVKELAVVRALQFKGSSVVPESDILKAFREKRVGISKEAVFNPANVQKANRVIRELYASKGYPNAVVKPEEEEVSATSVALTFDVDQGNRSRLVEIDFEGNEKLSDAELRGALQLVKETGLIARFKGEDILDLQKLQYDLQKNVRQYMYSKGYFQSRIGEPEVVGLGYKRTGFPLVSKLPLPLVTSKDNTLKIVVPVSEGRLYCVGTVKVEGNSIFSEEQILSYLGAKKGEVVEGKQLTAALYEDLKKVYGSQGFVQYDAELEPSFRDDAGNAEEGIVDLTIKIDEGRQFRLRRLEFSGNTFTRDRVLRREVLINEGDIYNQRNLEYSVARLNQTGYFDPIDKDKDIEIKADEEQADVDLVMKVKERGRQQIQFNGGVSGIGGTTFGMEYSTNNLIGRGETLSLNLGFGNRQKSFQLTFLEPYFKSRPINVGVSLFGSSYKFYGEGTYYSENTAAYTDYLNSSYGYTSSVATDSDNLFTQNTYGASVFATAPLSELFFKKRPFTQFSRLGLTYQISATSIKDPPVNSSGDPTKTIPIVFAQPNYITSRLTGSFVYDTRQPSENGIDTARGRQFSFSAGFSGLGGDVRTYQTNLSYSQFIPVRRRKSKNPEVFAFRLMAGNIGSYSTSSKIANSNSLSFINGIPYSERFFLGSENDIRGYDSRSLGPIAPIAGFLTTQNVVVATNSTGTPVEAENLTAAQRSLLTALGTYTGASGTNPLLTSVNARVIGGDTQLLGNFEYRLPVYGPVTMAAFADIGTVFNVRRGGIQTINSSFLRDDLYLGANSLTTYGYLASLANNSYQTGFNGGFVLKDGNPLTTTAYQAAYCTTDEAGTQTCPTALPSDLTKVFLRGNAQTNTLIDVGSSAFSKFKDFRSSVGLELRVQVPIVNVPFRLIYYYNPNGKFGYTQELPNVFLSGKRSGFRFSVGRTF